jgi:phenylpropionate dioxygenase-like ring-hydroxylating dioxygenase large terminal subunit
MSDRRPRFPYPLPYGWFSLGRVDELPGTPVVPLEAFGLQLVLWHDGDTYHVTEAWCPHLGAHIGYGGRVEAGCLVCPFHEWAFAPDGTNAAIPYADRPNRKARLRIFPTVMRNGHLLAWYHPDPSTAPMWDVPEFLPGNPVECLRMDRRITTAWQELAENSVDMSHFRSVHGLRQVSTVDELHIDGPYRRVRSGQSFKTARGEFEGRIESHSHGPGIGLVRFTLMSTVTLVSTITPIDEDELDVRFTMYHEAGDELATRIGAGFGAEVTRQLDQDIPIWEHKRYQPSPALAPSERPITEFRRWAGQFYAELPAHRGDA